MTQTVDVKLFFNFRSPYCYLASKTLWPIVDDFNTNLIWRPVGSWDLRSPPDRAKAKIPVARQDIARFAKRLGIPLTPPPATTDPTLAGVGSLYAEEQGLLRPYIVEVMRQEWAHGRDIGEIDVLLEVAEDIGLNSREFATALDSSEYRAQLQQNADEAADLGVIGVPTFVIGDQIFWGQDRIDFVLDELRELRATRA